MKRVLLLSLVVLMFTAGATRTQTEFTGEVRDVATRFAQRLKETREFRPEGDELFVERFVDCHLQAQLEKKDNNIFGQIRASLPPGAEARDEDVQKHLIAQLNLFHLRTLYRMSTRDLEGKWDDSLYTAEEEYPPGVYKLLLKNPLLARAAVNERVNIAGSNRNLQELRSVLSTLEDANSAMREYFKAHPPEETELYKKNVERIGNDKNNSKFWEVSFHQLTDEQIKESKQCLGFAARSFAIVKAPPFYQLFIFQDGKRFKIGSLACTEPPCVD